MLMMVVAYRALWRAALPAVRWLVRRRDRRRGHPTALTNERLGVYASTPATVDGQGPWTCWIHGASVGECLSALPLVDFVLSPRFDPDARSHRRPRRVVLTTATVAARELLRRRLAERHPAADVTCVLAPLDAPTCVDRFLATYRPSVGLWVESELWPTLMLETARRDIPMGLVNGRMSPRSAWWWRLPLLRSLAAACLSRFSLVACQDEANQRRFAQLGARAPEILPNLKFAAVESAATAASNGDDADGRLRESLAGRAVWVAASTHADEELLMTGVHEVLTRRLDLRRRRLLTVLVPRHPERTPEIVGALRRAHPSLVVTSRSGIPNGLPTADTDVFLVDTMGELARVFRAIPTVVVGGSFVPRGGHNPVEPLAAGCRVIMGPHAFNFADILGRLESPSSLSTSAPPLVRRVETVEALVECLVEHLLEQPTEDKDADQGPRRQAIAASVRQLASSTRGHYEARLVQWLLSQHHDHNCSNQ